jgi:hypothetical protein
VAGLGGLGQKPEAGTLVVDEEDVDRVDEFAFSSTWTSHHKALLKDTAGETFSGKRGIRIPGK